MEFYQSIRSYIETLPIIDTHEHIPEREKEYRYGEDIIAEYFSQYISSDLISAGLPEDEHKKLMGPGDILEKWDVLAPYWEKTKNTGYARAVAATVRRLYGINEINGKTIEEINWLYGNADKKHRYQYILKDICHIDTALTCSVNYQKIYDREYCIPVYFLDEIVYPYTWEMFQKIGDQVGIPINTFSSWLEACERYLDYLCEECNTKVFKICLAYFMSLQFPLTAYHTAEEAFHKTLRDKLHLPSEESVEFEPGKEFTSFMMHFVLSRLSRKEKVTIQIHTGLQEGTGNRLYHADPLLLCDLFLLYPQLRFDLFHMSYPFTNTAIALTKSMHNVFLDLCWAHIISPEATVRAMLEIYDTVPWNKLSAFGGDASHVDTIVGNLSVAKDNISEFLTRLREKDKIDFDEAKKLARQILIDNPKEIFWIY